MSTLDPHLPEVDAVRIENGRVVSLGERALAGSACRQIRLSPGELALPAFADAHLHLRSAAAARCSVDCSEESSVAGVLAAIAARAETVPGEAWIRASGYDEALLEERRHPTRSELDSAAAGRPVVLHHATGHAAVLSTRALRAIGAEDAGEGLLVDRHDLLERVPRLDQGRLRRGLAEVVRELRASGVVSVTDATHLNDERALRALDDWLESLGAEIEVGAMIGWDRIGSLRFGDSVGRVRVGEAKIMPLTNGLCAARDGAGVELGEAVAAARAAGFPVAIHVVEIEVLEQALGVLRHKPPPAGTRDRIEHCSLALPEQLDRLSELPVEVAMQPSFLSYRGAKYREQLRELERSWLCPVSSLLERGVHVRFSSDAPVVPPRPLEWVRAATRRDLAPEEAVGFDAALRCSCPGPLEVGGDARLAVLDVRSEPVRVASLLDGPALAAEAGRGPVVASAAAEGEACRSVR
ncbi:MAG: amidohydrolase family protein [Proteobacteria bacterium]|nr:amidohydrolase family protein [Pseudomonadota bacterium]